MYGLKEYQVNGINAVFGDYPEIVKVIIYGSRAKGNHRNNSDIDLTIVGGLDFNELLEIENKLDDLLLPYEIDLTLHEMIDDPELLSHIDRVGKVFYANENAAVDGSL